ncbi:EAL and HDOD domain-containing protein [Granulicella sibirica]|uniref:EAL and HDOD domain-containing protein n=1 Tax=Granulicella sibirica TaxID=2479048 RepID=UPI001376231D|nr:HDOD domain-containing protein [Granulicella sibirica]
MEEKLANGAEIEQVGGPDKGIDLVTVPTRFIGRQPILDARKGIYGHELLFRSGLSNAFSGDAEDATRDVIDQCLLLMPDSGDQATFINCTRHSLVSGIVTLLPPASTVLEILENVDPDPELMEVCRGLRSKGYRFALDDFSPEYEKLAFLEVADFVKVDFRASDARTREEIYRLAAPAKARLIAEKVETEADVHAAKAEGCTLYQGYFFCKPIVVSTQVIPQNQVIYLRMLAALTRTPANIFEVEKLVMSDASICYRLLRLVNSAIYGLSAPITSIRSALLMVGDDEFRKMVTVALAGLAGTAHSKAVVQMALERAKFCELLAPLMNESASKLYLLGMLSLIDVILGMPMSQIVDSLPVDREMKAALLGTPSTLARALDLVRCHESGDWREHRDIQKALGLTERTASMIYVESVRWADKATRAAEK